MNKISVIIPIYNAEQHVGRCIESILKQTYENIEIILVNDGSTDNSPKIIDEYSQIDQRIIVLHKKNGGLSDARNAGLKLVSGSFISFIDNDDIISDCFYEVLLEVMLDNNADIVECNYLKFENDIGNVFPDLDFSTNIYNAENALKLLMLGSLKQVVWNKLYRKDVIKNLDFEKDRMNEDEFWTYKVFGNAKVIIKITPILYFYRQHPTSMMGKRYDLNRLDGLRALNDRIIYMKHHFPSLENLAIRTYCLGAIWHYRQLDFHYKTIVADNDKKNLYKVIKSYNHFQTYRKWSWKDLVTYHLFLLSPKYYLKLLKKIEK